MTRVFLPDAAAAGEATRALRVLAISFAAQGLVPLVSALFQAVGRARPAYLLSVGTLLAVRLPLVALLAGRGPGATWGALVIGDVLSAAIALVMLRRSPVERSVVAASRSLSPLDPRRRGIPLVSRARGHDTPTRPRPGPPPPGAR